MAIGHTPLMSAPTSTAYVALTGNPNCGKTTLFNALTGLRAKVGNYAGVTVERKEGQFRSASGRHYRLLDLPGTYSLKPTTLDDGLLKQLITLGPDSKIDRIYEWDE